MQIQRRSSRGLILTWLHEDLKKVLAWGDMRIWEQCGKVSASNYIWKKWSYLLDEGKRISQGVSWCEVSILIDAIIIAFSITQMIKVVILMYVVEIDDKHHPVEFC